MKKVTIYSTPSCHYCKEVKKYFDDRDITYTTIDVTTDPVAKAYMIERSGQMGVPVTIIDDEVIVGFNKVTLANAIGKE